MEEERAAGANISDEGINSVKGGLMGPLAAAGLPPAVGSVTGLIALLYQEDG